MYEEKEKGRMKSLNKSPITKPQKKKKIYLKFHITGKNAAYVLGRVLITENLLKLKMLIVGGILCVNTIVRKSSNTIFSLLFY